MSDKHYSQHLKRVLLRLADWHHCQLHVGKLGDGIKLTSGELDILDEEWKDMHVAVFWNSKKRVLYHGCLSKDDNEAMKSLFRKYIGNIVSYESCKELAAWQQVKKFSDKMIGKVTSLEELDVQLAVRGF